MKQVQKMWRVYDVLFTDKTRAEAVRDGNEIVKEVFVGVDTDITLDPNGMSADFFGSWIFTNEEEAQSEVNEFNL